MSKVKVTKYDEGPYVLQGEFELVDGKGNVFVTGDTMAICRCGQSQKQPFCDGTHKARGFVEASEAR